MSSFTEENYLKAIYKLMEIEGENVSTNSIAKEMDIKASAVTDMLKKMSEKELINYEKYQGVSLTGKGKKEALLIIRKHRLWEVFLVQILEFRWDEVHNVAEQLEHVNSDQLIERLDKFLNYPTIDPHGDLIPDKEGNFQIVAFKKLTELTAGRGTMAGILDHSPAFLKYLDKIGLTIGTRLEIKEIYDFDKSVLVSINDLPFICLSYEAARNILVK
jgi:DtxR family Mn-dependent transcriptional regulator